MAEVLQEPFCLEAHSLHSGSISFGRFETEPLSWERRSAFSCNNYLEEVEKYSKPGSVNQRKAYFEVFFKRKGLLQPPDSLCQNWTDCQAIEEELADDSNFNELCGESLPECDEEISNNNSEYAVKEAGELYQPQSDYISLKREDKRQAYVKPKVKAETGRSHTSSKLPENHQMLGKSSSGLIKSNRATLEARAELKTASTKLQRKLSSNVVAKDSTHLQKEDLSRSRTVKQLQHNILTAKTSLTKTSKSMELSGVDKQKQHTSAKVKETGKAGSVLQTSNKRKDGSIIGQSASRPQNVARSSTEKTTKPGASTIISNHNGRKAANKNNGKDARIKQTPESNKLKATRTPAIHSMNVPRDIGEKMAVPVLAETTKSGRKSSDPASKVAEVEPIASTPSSIRPFGTQISKRSATPSKKILPGGKQVESKRHDSSPSQMVSKSSKLSTLQSQSSHSSPVRRDPKESSASSSVKLLSSHRMNRSESPAKNNFPTKHLPVGNRVENIKRDLSRSQTVCKPSKLAKLQPKSSSLSPVRRAPSESSTSSSIKQLRSQGTDRTESPKKNNLSSKGLIGEKEVTSKNRGLDTSQKVTKSPKLEKLLSMSSTLSPVRRSPSKTSASSSLKELSSRRTNRTESPLKNDLLMKCIPRGKDVAAKERDSDGSQTVSKQSKLEKLQPKISSPSPVGRAPAASSKTSSMQNNSPAKCQTSGKEAAIKKRDIDILFTVTNPSKFGNLQHESSSPISVLKAAASSSTSSSVGDLSPPPDKGFVVPRKSNEKNFPAKCPPEVEQVDAKKRPSDISHSGSKPIKLAKLQCKSSSPSPTLNMKRSGTPKENRNDTKQGGTKKHNVNPLKRELISNKTTKSQGKPSASASGPVGSTTRTYNIESLGRVESVKAVKRSESPRKDAGTPKRAVSVSNQMDKVGKKVAAVR